MRPGVESTRPSSFWPQRLTCGRPLDTLSAMSTRRLENVNVVAFDLMPSPEEIQARLPISEAAAESVFAGRETIQRILDRADPRLFVIVGPCSIHDLVAGYDYAQRLRHLAEEVKDTLVLVMR